MKIHYAMDEKNTIYTNTPTPRIFSENCTETPFMDDLGDMRESNFLFIPIFGKILRYLVREGIHKKAFF